MVPASITVQGALSRWARRTAILVVLAIPFVGGMPILPCVLAAFLYGHVGQASRRRGRFKLTRAGVGAFPRFIRLISLPFCTAARQRSKLSTTSVCHAASCALTRRTSLSGKSGRPGATRTR